MCFKTDAGKLILLFIIIKSPQCNTLMRIILCLIEQYIANLAYDSCG